MYFQTRGIFLKQTPYSETSAVVKVYTEEFGLQAYIVKGFKNRKSKVRSAFLQPLAVLDMIVTRREKAGLQHIREVKPAIVFKTLSEDIKKTSVLLFINELLYKTLQEENPHKEMFSFIVDSLLAFDEPEGFSNYFHLSFAMKLTEYLGFFPGGRYCEETSVFDLEGGTFIPSPNISGFGFIMGEECQYFDRLLVEDTHSKASLKVPVGIRRELLEKILLYYSYHIPTAKDFKSHLVLHQVLSS